MATAPSRTAHITTPYTRRRDGSPVQRPPSTPQDRRPPQHPPRTTPQPVATTAVTTSLRRPQATQTPARRPQLMTTPRPLYWTPKPPTSTKPNTTVLIAQEEKLRLGYKLDNVGEGNQVQKRPRGRARSHGFKRRRKLRAGAVRLVSPDGLLDRGRVEIFIRGEWGTVCDDLFTSKAGTVVCRQLGFTGALAVMKRAVLGEAGGHVRILLDDVECEGGERSLLECKRSKIGKHNCSHEEDVGVICGYSRGEV